VSVGDEVLVNYYESLVMRVLKPEKRRSTRRARRGEGQGRELPAVGAQQVTVTVSSRRSTRRRAR